MLLPWLPYKCTRTTGVHWLLTRQDLCKTWFPARVPRLRCSEWLCCPQRVQTALPLFWPGLLELTGVPSPWGTQILGTSTEPLLLLPILVGHPRPPAHPAQPLWGAAGAASGSPHSSRTPLTPLLPLPVFQNMPNVRDHDASVYLRLQGDALSVGGYESNPIFWEEVSGARRFFSWEKEPGFQGTHLRGVGTGMSPSAPGFCGYQPLHHRWGNPRTASSPWVRLGHRNKMQGQEE